MQSKEYIDGVLDTTERFTLAVLKHSGYFKNKAIVAVLDLAITITDEVTKELEGEADERR